MPAIVRNAVRLFRIGGVEVAVHVSWLVIFLLVTWSLAIGYFPIALPAVDAAEAWVLGAIASLLLFAAVLVHEVAHAMVARWRGIEVRSITLFIFGGVANLGGEAKSPSTEFLVAVVGPLTSLAVAALAFGVALGAQEPRVVAIAEYLVFVNVALAAFNLLPAFPLDGGRVLRSVVWSLTGSLRRATSLAAGVGRLAAWGFVAWGVWRILQDDLIGGVWIAALGWFLHNAATASEFQHELEAALEGVAVRDVIQPDSTIVPPDLPVDRLVEEYLLAGNRRAVPVAAGGELVGMVTISDVQRIAPDQRSALTTGEIMGGRDGVVAVDARDSLRHAVQLLLEGDFEELPVLDGDRVVGVLSRAAALRQFELRRALGVGPARGNTGLPAPKPAS